MMAIKNAIAFLLTLVSFIVNIGNADGSVPKYYVREAIVLEYINDEIVFEDNTENLWGADKEVFEFEIGDECTLVMDSMGTPTIYDDEICEVVYGWNSYGLPVAYADYHDFHNLHVD